MANADNGIGSASVLAESRGASTPLRRCGAHDAQKPWGRRDGCPRHRHCRFRRVTQKLEEDGILLLTDVVREEDESLPVYLRRYCDWLRSDWSALGAEEKRAIGRGGIPRRDNQ